MEEIWKDIDGYNGLYKVSNTGRVKSMDWNHLGRAKELSTFNNGGYRRVAIVRGKVRKNYLVHRLVAEAFIPKVDGKDDVNHIDGNKLNNNVENLEWVTKGENTRHAIKLGLRPLGCNHRRMAGAEGTMSKPVYQYTTSGELVKKWSWSGEAAEQLGGYRPCITRCCRGERNTYKGYVWKYE